MILTAVAALIMIGILSPLQLAHADSLKTPDYLIGNWQGEGKNVYYSDISLQDLKLELRFSSSGDIAGSLGANPLKKLQLSKWSAVDSIRTNETFDHKLEAYLDGMLNGTSYAGPILIGLINQDDHWLARPYLSAERLKAESNGLAPLAHYLMAPTLNEGDSNSIGEQGRSLRESTSVVVTDDPTTNMLRFSLVVPEGSTGGEPLSWHPAARWQALPLYVESAAAFTESDLETITAKPFVGPSADPQSERWQIHLELTESAAQRFAEFTQRHIGQRVAIVIDGMVLSAPRVNETIPGGRVVIDGTFTEASARQLADQLRQAMTQRWLRGSVVETHADAIESSEDGSVVLEGNATVVIEANGRRARISGDRIELKRNPDGELEQRVFSNPRIEILNGNDRASSATTLRSNANDRTRAREEAIPAIDIVAIGRPAKWPSRWWNLEGHSVSGRPSWMQGETGSADIAVVYRRTSPPGAIDINLTLPDAINGMSTSSTYGAHTEITWARMQQDDMEAFIANEGTVDLVVKAGSGPWAEVATIREGETIEADGGRFHLQRVAAQRDKKDRWFGEDTPGLVLIEGRYDFDRDWEVAIVAEDQAGNRSEVESITGSGMFSQHENRRWHQFVSMDKRDISRFIILKRPVQGHTMENLPLVPNVDRQIGTAVQAPGEIESDATESATEENSTTPSLAIHRVLSAPDVTRQESVRALNLNALELDPEPLLIDEDIVEYDWETHLVRLKPGVREHIMPRDPELKGIPFMVVAHGERIYLGAFWTPASSFAHFVPVIHTRPFDLIQEDGSRIEDAFIIHPSFGTTGQDPADAREDPRIHAALSAAGKLSAAENSDPAAEHSDDLLTAPIHIADGDVILKSVRIEPMESNRSVVVAEAANRSDQEQHLGIEIYADLDRFPGGASHQAEIFTLEPGFDGHLRREFKLINRPFFTNGMNDVRLQIARTQSAEYYRESGTRFLPPDAEMILDTRLNLSVD